MYHPIFEAAPDAAVFGAAVPQAKVQQALSEGAAAVFGDAAVLFQLDQSLDDSQYQSRIQLQDDAHCGALPEDMLPGMVEAQRLRDAQLAEATVAALADAMAQSDAPQVVVIAGNGHAREDWGVPALLSFYYADDPRVQVRTFAQYEVSSPETAPYTSWLATEPADRNDPCEVFRK